MVRLKHQTAETTTVTIIIAISNENSKTFTPTRNKKNFKRNKDLKWNTSLYESFCYIKKKYININDIINV